MHDHLRRILAAIVGQQAGRAGYGANMPPRPQASTTYSPVQGEGFQRAHKRLMAKRKANAAIPSGYRFTRQQRRALQRQHDKETEITAAEAARQRIALARHARTTQAYS